MTPAVTAWLAAGRAVLPADLTVDAQAARWADPASPLHELLAAPPAGWRPAEAAGRLHEALLAADERRGRGVHYTPVPLAARLIGWGSGPSIPADGATVHDPAVGGGAFLVAAVDRAVAAGADPLAALGRLSGTDLDPVAVAVARTAVALAAVEHGAPADAARATVADRITRGDGLLDDPGTVPVDLVVGNPPFLGQLRRRTARDRAAAAALRARYGDAAGGYVDAAALFLLAGLAAVRPGGRVVLLQPESVLGARDAEGVRAAVGAAADVVGLWVAAGRAFAGASVDVAAIVLERRAASEATAPAHPDRPVALAVGVERWRDVGAAEPPSARTWSPLLATARGVPRVALDPAVGTLADLATATAGFRQHHYALADHLVEVGPDGPSDGVVPLLTVGLVDPLHAAWGERPTRVSGRRWSRPGVDLAGVAATDPDVAAWFGARRVAKVLVAPQTRVVEAVADPTGRFLPAVPLVSVEPRPDAIADDGDAATWAWRVAAALSAPPVTAWARRESAGTARSGDALRLAARQVLAVPLPVDRDRWDAAAAALAAGAALADVAGDLTAAYGLAPDDAVVAWWRARLSPG